MMIAAYTECVKTNIMMIAFHFPYKLTKFNEIKYHENVCNNQNRNYKIRTNTIKETKTRGLFIVHIV